MIHKFGGSLAASGRALRMATTPPDHQYDLGRRHPPSTPSRSRDRSRISDSRHETVAAPKRAAYSQRKVRGASRMRIWRAGIPATTAFSDTSQVTTALVPTIELWPTRTPRRMQAP